MATTAATLITTSITTTSSGIAHIGGPRKWLRIIPIIGGRAIWQRHGPSLIIAPLAPLHRHHGALTRLTPSNQGSIGRIDVSIGALVPEQIIGMVAPQGLIGVEGGEAP